MASRVLYSDEYDREIAQGTLAPETFDYRILCEGDSWMDRSSIFQLSLPWALAQTSTAPRATMRCSSTWRASATPCAASRTAGTRCSTSGSTPTGCSASTPSCSARAATTSSPRCWSRARATASCTGVHGAPPGLQADDCYNVDAVADLVTSVIDPSFDAIYRRVRTSRNPDVPILLNCYNMPVARRRWHCCRRPREAPAAAATGSTRSIRTSRDGPGSRRPGRRNWTRSSDSSPLQF